MPGLLDQTDAGGLSDADLQALFLGGTTAEDAPAGDAAPPAPPAADTPGFFDRLSSGIGKAGMALAGGDPGLTTLSPDQQRAAGSRALLNLGLSMLANSGPSYTPRNFGQILAAGLESAQRVPIGMEQMVAAQNAQNTELALKRGVLQIQGLTAQTRLKQLQILLDRIAGGKKAADDAAGGGSASGAPAPSLAPGASPAAPDGSETDFLSKFSPIAAQVSQATGLPADFVTAQAALETGYGRSPAAQRNNFFGITGADGKPLAYDTPEAGVKAYTDLVTGDRYKGVARTGDHKALGDALAVAGYNPNVPAEGKADSYGARIAGVAAHIAGLRGAAAPAVQVAGPGAGSPVVPPPAAVPGAPAPAPGQAVAPPPAAPGQGAAAPPAAELPPALVTPPALPDMVAPSIAALEPDRKAILANFEARRRALAASPNVDTAQQISTIEKERDDKLAALSKEARDRQVAFDDQRRKDAVAYQVRVAEENRAFQRGQQEKDAELKRQMALKEHEQLLQQQTTSAGVQIAADTDTLKKTAEAAQTARDMRNNLQQIRAVLPDVPSGAQLLQHFPELGDWLTQLRIATPSEQAGLTAAKLLQGITANVSVMMRPLGSGALRTAEMQNFQRALPTLAQTSEGRTKALAFLENASNRITQENDFMMRYRMDHGNLIGAEDAMSRPKALGGLGPMIPSAPAFDAPAAEHQRYLGGLEPGQPYYAWQKQPDGSFRKVLDVKK